MKFNKKKLKNFKKNKIFINNSNKKFGVARIFSTFNNTIITITDKLGNTVSWATSSSVGFKGPKKSSPYSAQLASERAAVKAFNLGFRDVDVVLKGPGYGRDSSIRGLVNSGMKIVSISDVTPLPHNGCKPRKIRRN